MIESGIIDPLLVTKSALKNAASVATTILSTDCVINNLELMKAIGKNLVVKISKAGISKTKGGLTS